MTKSIKDMRQEYYSSLGMSAEYIKFINDTYGDKPATLGEAVYILHIRLKEFSQAVKDSFKRSK